MRRQNVHGHVRSRVRLAFPSLERMPFSPARFVIDGLDGPYAGFTDGSLWNGWACPVFTREVADQIAEDFNRQGEWAGFPTSGSARFDADADAYEVAEEGNDPELFLASTIEVGGRSVKVYEFGTRYWTWESA